MQDYNTLYYCLEFRPTKDSLIPGRHKSCGKRIFINERLFDARKGLPPYVFTNYGDAVCAAPMFMEDLIKSLELKIKTSDLKRKAMKEEEDRLAKEITLLKE